MPLGPHLPSPVAALLAVLPTPIVTLFWLWALVSIVILVVRAVRRLTGGSDESAEAVDAASTAASGAPLEPAPPAPPGPMMPPSPTAPLGAASPSLPDDPTTATAPPASVPPAASGGRSGFFAAAPDDGDAPTAAAGAARPTVAEALQGIAMPCGLSPVIDGTVSIPNPFRVAFLTTEADAAAVGAGVGDELERLGYRLATVAATELIARKPGVELRVVLYPTPGAARRGLEAVFPTAPPGSVGIELST